MRAVALVTVAAALLIFTAEAGAQQRPKAGAGSFDCRVPPQLDSTIPADAATPTSQANMNCFAWQEFIALNWKADTGMCDASDAPASGFGEPGDTDPVVWETYKTPEDVFLPGAAEPDAWCSDGGAPKRLHAASKFAGVAPIDLTDFHEASMGAPWLTSQSGLLTMYEIRMNEDEFGYIKDNELYNALAQASFAADPQKGINLPDGTTVTYGKVGTIELKAAWLELDDRADWPRYKIARAQVTYPGQDPKTVTVGLVGLHIIHKTKTAQQFAWATFEHVDNVPGDGDPQQSYTYNNPGCSAQQCPPNEPPAAGDYHTPVQVVRENPLDSDVIDLNKAVKSMIRGANSDSVYQNYELVNVLWPGSNTPIPPGSRLPLTEGDPTPSPPSQGGQEVVANTTMETYVQDAATCLDCHANFASIAPTTGDKTLKLEKPDGSPAPSASGPPPYAADYSFLLRRAQVPSGADEKDGVPAVVLLALATAALAAGAAYAVGRRRAA